jgi:hypothetical protein
MNDVVKSLVSSNLRSSRYAMILVPILSSLLMIAVWVHGDRDYQYFSFPLICSLLVASSFALIGSYNDVQNGWCSFVASYHNDRKGMIGSIIMTFYLETAISCAIALLVISVFDIRILAHVAPTLAVATVGVALVFSAALLAYSYAGAHSAFIIAVPMSAIYGGIILYLSVARMLVFEPYILLIAIVGILAMHALSLRAIAHLDL